MAEEEPPMCRICFTPIDAMENPRGVINSCDHLFCSHCITEWSGNTNLCPFCKQRFNRITTTRMKKKELDADERALLGAGVEPPMEAVTEVKKVRKRNLRADVEYSDEDEEWEDGTIFPAVQRAGPVLICAICQDGEDVVSMLMCDRRTCDYVAHMACLGLTEEPPVFICDGCGGMPEAAAAPAQEAGNGGDTAMADNEQPASTREAPTRSEEDAALAAELQQEDDNRFENTDFARPEVAPAVRVPAPAPAPAPQQQTRDGYPVVVRRVRRSAVQQQQQQQQQQEQQARANADAEDGDDANVPYFLRGGQQQDAAKSELQRRTSRIQNRQLLAAERAANYTMQANRAGVEMVQPWGQHLTSAAARQRAQSGVQQNRLVPLPPQLTGPRANPTRRAAPTGPAPLEDVQQEVFENYFSQEMEQLKRERATPSMDARGNVVLFQGSAHSMQNDLELRAEARKRANQKASEYMEKVRVARHEEAARALRREKAREAAAMAKLTQMIMQKRTEQLRLRQQLGAVPSTEKKEEESAKRERSSSVKVERVKTEPSNKRPPKSARK